MSRKIEETSKESVEASDYTPACLDYKLRLKTSEDD